MHSLHIIQLMLSRITVQHLIVVCVFFEMSLNTAAQLENPAPLSLQGSGEGLPQKSSMISKMLLLWLNMAAFSDCDLTTISSPLLSACQGVHP